MSRIDVYSEVDIAEFPEGDVLHHALWIIQNRKHGEHPDVDAKIEEIARFLGYEFELKYRPKP